MRPFINSQCLNNFFIYLIISAGLIVMVIKLSLFGINPFGFYAALFQISIDILMIVLFFLQVKFNQIQSKAVMKAT